MKYQKIVIFLDNEITQPSRFQSKNGLKEMMMYLEQ